MGVRAVALSAGIAKQLTESSRRPPTLKEVRSSSSPVQKQSLWDFLRQGFEEEN